MTLLRIILFLTMGVARVSAASSDLLSALKFMTAGWVAIPGFLDELKSKSLRDKISRAEIKARLAYVDFSYQYLEKNFLPDEQNIDDECIVPSRRKRDNGLDGRTTAELTAIVDSDIALLNQCLGIVKAQSRNATLPYFQSLNVHRLDDEIYGLATSKKLGRMAAVLLQEPRVSLYQTAVFVQAASGGVARGTSWHRDLNMVPLDTRHMGHVTVWCPLQDLNAQDDSVLTFAMGSHRDLSYQHWFPDPQSAAQLKMILEDRYRFGRMESMKVGDCTAHHGWVFHSAPAQVLGTRTAIAFSYVSSRTGVLPDLDGNNTRNHRPFTREDELGYSPWLQDVQSRGIVEGNEYLPVVYDEQLNSASKGSAPVKGFRPGTPRVAHHHHDNNVDF